MDGNKDEAFKCLKIAKDSIRSGDRNRALKFLNKARRLDPSIEIDDLLSNLNSQDKTTDENPSSPSKTGPRRRVSPAATGPSSSSSSSAAYTEEHVTVVREIRRKKDYYEILGLEKSCSAEDIRKAYRKISLKVHPDKNQAPGSEEAFKMVSKAFQCLSDEEGRKKYDLVGSEEPVYERRAGSGGVNGMRGFNNGFYDGDVDAEEIFRNFFFGGMHPATTGNFGGFSFGPGVRVRTGGVGVDQGSNWMRTLIQLLPVILLLLVNLLPSSEPVYSLSQSYSYDTRFITTKGVSFYVKSASKFDQQYPPNSQERVSIEQRVEDEYHSVLVHNCRLEWQQLHWGYRRETPNCDALKRFEAMGQ
ncbi:chaperone protein Dnaj 49 [Phtheirospermum japonicum]|uniref:Chaperone protein Dnaj 49 n=1 Tax=Phtheirospermum japonicum TaxID=374723 RepID=A0A830CVW3_9LAMI|nr:chaperone protein Dnaj 49 [Phtheirospermum japonicum]